MFKALISTLTEEESTTLKAFMKASSAVPGKIIMQKGEVRKDIYFIISGRYEIYQQLLVGGQRISFHLATLEGPKLLGDFNLFLDHERQATVLATTDCKYFMLSQESLQQLKDEHPRIALKILEHAGQVVTKRLCDLQDRIYGNIIKESETTAVALNKINKYIGKTQLCPQVLARKLFPQ